MICPYCRGSGIYRDNGRGDRLRQLRVSRGITLRLMASRMGIPKCKLSRLERDLDPWTDTLVELFLMELPNTTQTGVTYENHVPFKQTRKSTAY